MKATDQIFKNEKLCCYCGVETIKQKSGTSKPFPNMRTVEHLIPRTRGGKSSKMNTQIACWECNTQKGRLTEAEYRVVLEYRKGIRLDFSKHLANIVRHYSQVFQAFATAAVILILARFSRYV